MTKDNGHSTAYNTEVLGYLAKQKEYSPSTLKFLRDVKVTIQYNKQISSLDKTLLSEAVEQIEKGQLQFEAWTSPEEYLSCHKQVQYSITQKK